MADYHRVAHKRGLICGSVNPKREHPKATYKWDKCGMSVNATCGHCDAPLENDTLKLDDGREVQISQCPNGHGKIKSPLCCGEDMSCSL